MKKLLALFGLLAALPAYAVDCGNMGQWLGAACDKVAGTFANGTRDLYVSGYAWHDPATYTAEKRKELNDKAWGLGYGKHLTDAKGNDDLVYGMLFKDSHATPELIIGYGHLWNWQIAGPVSAGLGYTVGLTSRQDIFGGIPFPAAFPLAQIKVDRFVVMATAIPKLGGGLNHGNVAYVFGRYEWQ